ncbi:MAG: hypothetical protein K2N51_17080 [Lachnospiraceae bacterium]|nr:hypothetical protein [Lachnospiraceae bacterium]
MQLYESKKYKGQLMLYEGGEKYSPLDSRQATWVYKTIQRIQMERLDKGLEKLPLEDYLSNNGKNKYYFIVNKIANKAVRLRFGLDRTYTKKEMTPAMLEYRTWKMERIIASLLLKLKGEIKHMSPLIYENLVMKVIDNEKDDKELANKSE